METRTMIIIGVAVLLVGVAIWYFAFRDKCKGRSEADCEQDGKCLVKDNSEKVCVKKDD